MLAIETKDIIRFEATTNYTNIYFNERKNIITSKTLKIYDELVREEKNFVRVHRAHLVNILYINKIDTRGFLVLIDKTVIPISRRKKPEVLKKINSYCNIILVLKKQYLK